MSFGFFSGPGQIFEQVSDAIGLPEYVGDGIACGVDVFSGNYAAAVDDAVDFAGEDGGVMGLAQELLEGSGPSGGGMSSILSLLGGSAAEGAADGGSAGDSVLSSLLQSFLGSDGAGMGETSAGTAGGGLNVGELQSMISIGQNLLA